MTKNKHPQTRAERLALKKVSIEKKTRHAGKVRRGLLEPLKEAETEHELQTYRNGDQP